MLAVRPPSHLIKSDENILLAQHCACMWLQQRYRCWAGEDRPRKDWGFGSWAAATKGGLRPGGLPLSITMTCVPPHFWGYGAVVTSAALAGKTTSACDKVLLWESKQQILMRSRWCGLDAQGTWRGVTCFTKWEGGRRSSTTMPHLATTKFCFNLRHILKVSHCSTIFLREYNWVMHVAGVKLSAQQDSEVFCHLIFHESQPSVK